jgi:glycosyltransferase involved in cell wall biosynthesis
LAIEAFIMKHNHFAISVAICTYNPRPDYLQRVLYALRCQTLTNNQWELVIVDNNSSYPLASVCQIDWHPNSRIVFVEQRGLTPARIKAISESHSDLLLFVDDDNVLQEDYLENALNIAIKCPWVGAWSGSYSAEYEIPPPPEFAPLLAGLVVDSICRPYWTNLVNGAQAAPPGAGMVVRKLVAERWSELAKTDSIRLKLGPNGASPGAGDDADMALCSLEFGLGTGRFPELKLTHLIPARKLTLQYLKQLYFGQSYANVVVNSIYGQSRREKSEKLFHYLVFLYLWVRAKSFAERSIRYAQLRGKLRAIRDLSFTAA